MASKDEIQYVRYYAYGSAARKLEPEPEKRRKPRAEMEPKPKVERIPIAFDPIAVFGTAVAAVMLICVLIGFAQVNSVNDEIVVMENYYNHLKSENYALQKKYADGYDLEDIRAAAEAMGLVPVERVQHITVHIPEQEVVEELPWWQEMWNEFKAMFE